MNEVIVIGFSNSGKSTLARYIGQKHNYDIFEISKYVMEGYIGQTIFDTPIDFCDDCFHNGTLTQFAQRMIVESLQSDSKKVFVGPRTFEETELIKKMYPDAVVVGVVCDIVYRQKRYTISQMGKIPNRTLEERNEIEGRWGLSEEYIACSDRVIENNGSLEEYYARIDEMFSK